MLSMKLNSCSDRVNREKPLPKLKRRATHNDFAGQVEHSDQHAIASSIHLSTAHSRRIHEITFRVPNPLCASGRIIHTLRRLHPPYHHNGTRNSSNLSPNPADSKQADKLRTQQELERLQAKYIGTGHPDTTSWEWRTNIQRDTYASIAGHRPLLSYVALAENEPIVKVRARMIQVCEFLPWLYTY